MTYVRKQHNLYSTYHINIIYVICGMENMSHVILWYVACDVTWQEHVHTLDLGINQASLFMWVFVKMIMFAVFSVLKKFHFRKCLKKSVHSMWTGKKHIAVECRLCGGSGRKVWDEKWIQGSLRHEDGRADMFIMDCGWNIQIFFKYFYKGNSRKN